MAAHLLNIIITFKSPNVHWKDNLHMLRGGVPWDIQVKCARVCYSFQNMVINLTLVWYVLKYLKCLQALQRFLPSDNKTWEKAPWYLQIVKLITPRYCYWMDFHKATLDLYLQRLKSKPKLSDKLDITNGTIALGRAVRICILGLRYFTTLLMNST